ncbi:SusD/RagB family nutrient-binding outer membrane lipoprotein [Chitinophaga horti]|uniref:SusD/RagB family nutrient-binding outer membrane lipoprotein n=1 Tax=Chitinophaga horti TaxID=2920382 RepID=A0ABY6IV06_9BACT|nr:SusD/RagB family nutrient-binding outer membrane lipoprotein [Chitinophaga horti]UYQ91205.1 SusD/RagB family nutrient-binding outer membrane lipoprotein [Chitinophaga horti]
MKYLKYITNICIVAGLLATASCKRNFEEINTPPLDATDATTPEIFNAIISSLPLEGGEQSVLNAWIYPITQQAIITSGSYPYDNAINALWSNYYAALANYRIIEDRISKEANPATMNNLYAMLKTVMAYKTIKMTNYFGSMPYKDAGYAAIKKAVAYKVPYDKQPDIYAAVLTDLKWAVDNFGTGADQYSVGAYDMLLKSDIAQWTKFANSLRLQVAITMYDKNSTLAATHITEAMGKPLLEAGENIGMWPTKIPGLKFDWRQWSFSANCYLRMGSVMWNLMSNNNNADGSGIFDIRARVFYEPNNAGQWAAYPQNPMTTTPSEGGAPYDFDKRNADWTNKGAANIYSPVNFYFEKDITTIPELMLTAAQVYFLKAEAYNRGLGVAASPANAKIAYDAGIAASLNMWKGIAFASPDWTVGKPAAAAATAGEIAAVTTNIKTAYNLVAPATALNQIYAQYWIDAFRQPWDAWTLKRRTGNKTPMSADNVGYYNANFGTYARFVYPQEEFSFNNANWKTETGSNDVNTTKIWLQP